MARPYWSGQIQISLVSFGVKLFPATEAKSEIRFHQLSRKTGERIKHQKVSGDEGPVEKSDIVKGYEYRKGEYISIEPEEIENLRIPSRHNLVVTQFVDAGELDPAYFEKPYFVVPEDDVQAEAFAVVRKALQATKKVALGKIAFGGREHLVAISATADDDLAGMMAYTMRYAEELRNPAAYFADIKKVAVDEDQLSLAEELIKRKAAKFAPDKFTDEYEAGAPRDDQSQGRAGPHRARRACAQIGKGHQSHGRPPQEHTRQRRCGNEEESHHQIRCGKGRHGPDKEGATVGKQSGNRQVHSVTAQVRVAHGYCS